VPDAGALGELHERTRGWAAGAVLMLEHWKLSGHMAELPGDAAPRVVFDYLAGEIFDRFEPATQHFLLRIACLPRMTAEVAQALSGEAKAGRLLVNLALNHYFVDEIESEEGRVFQLHPLLRDFLRRRVVEDLPEALSAPTLQRAARLVREAGQPEDAVALLMECADWGGVAQVAAGQADALLAQGRGELLASWIESLPRERLEADPTLLHALGRCRLRTVPRAARRYFEGAFELFARAGDRVHGAESACGAVEAILFEFDDLAPLDRWTGILADAMREGEALLPTRSLLRAAVALGWALIHREPGSPELDRLLSNALDPLLHRDDADPDLVIELALMRSTAAALRGDAALAAKCLDALQASGERGATALALVEALQHLVAGASEAALSVAQNGLAASAEDAPRAAWLRTLATAAALGIDERDLARSELQKLETAGMPESRGHRAVQRYLRGWLAVREGDPGGASREARAAAETALEAGLPWLEALARAALARQLAESGDGRAREAQARSAEALAERLGSAAVRYCVQLATAESALVAGEEGAAAAALKGAFALGREHEYRNAPWWRPREAGDLCALALRYGIEPEYARSLARLRRLVPHTPPLRIRDWPWPFRIRTFGGFELLRGTAPIEFSGKAPGRPLELLKVLIAMGGHNVRADQLADALWPHAEADFAHKSFTAALHRLRRLFGDEESLILRDGRLSLNPALVWLDAWALEQTLTELDEGLRLPGAARAGSVLDALAAEALALYRGPFLPDESEQPSYLAYREQVRARLLRSLARLSRRREEQGQRESAADCYARMIEADDLFEAPYRYLMQCLQRAGEAAEARNAYERLRTVLATKRKILPSAETQAVYAGLGAPGAH
jgi:DNA-binding SARP family transcriptional activator